MALPEIITSISLGVNFGLLVICTCLYIKCRGQANKVVNLIAAHKRARKIITTLYQSGTKLTSQLENKDS